MMRWTEIVSKEDVCAALTDWLQSEHPRRTMPKVIFVTENLIEGNYTIETDAPIPEDSYLGQSGMYANYDDDD